MSVFDLNAPRMVSENLSMPKPAISTIANFMDNNEPPDPVKLLLMDRIPNA